MTRPGIDSRPGCGRADIAAGVVGVVWMLAEDVSVHQRPADVAKVAVCRHRSSSSTAFPAVPLGFTILGEICVYVIV